MLKPSQFDNVEKPKHYHSYKMDTLTFFEERISKRSVRRILCRVNHQIRTTIRFEKRCRGFEESTILPRHVNRIKRKDAK